VIQNLLLIIAVIVIGIGAYLLSYIRFKRIIAKQTKQMIALMKSEDLENLQIGDIFSEVDKDFSDLERAALSLRKKYLRLKRQSKEERRGYETVFSGLKEGIVTVDQNLRVISFNSSFMNFFKWAPLKEAASYSLQDIIRDPQVISTFKKTFENSRFNKIEGEQFQLFVTPLPSRNENESWCLGVFYDLTELRRTEKIRIDFVANASHEMRTPLTVIKGYAELLYTRLEAAQKTEELDLVRPILLGTDQLSDLMSELLNLSKVETGTQLTKDKISTEELTKDVLGELEPALQLTPKKINVQRSVEEVHANYDAARQIMRNLLINAVKYSGESSQIDLRWEPAGSAVLLKVKDNGPGIAREHQDRIFERFYRVDKGRNRDQGGFGLGLALVKHHMLNHGGNVKLISENGKGSEFICEFPN
jgi:two-component system phosphate regulon sensor histidine kinase PhoR